MTAVGKVPPRRTVVLEMLGLLPRQIGSIRTPSAYVAHTTEKIFWCRRYSFQIA